MSGPFRGGGDFLTHTVHCHRLKPLHTTQGGLNKGRNALGELLVRNPGFQLVLNYTVFSVVRLCGLRP